MAEKKELYGYDEEDILTLEFDDGVEEECGILGVFDALGKEYIALNPLGTEDVYIYGYKEYDEDYELIDIEDEEEFNKVVAEFEKLAGSVIRRQAENQRELERMRESFGTVTGDRGFFSLLYGKYRMYPV